MIDIGIIISWFTVNPFSTVALILSTTGAFLVSSRSHEWRKRGFLIWIVSNGLIGYGYYVNHDIPMVILFMGFYQICNIRGVVSNLDDEFKGSVKKLLPWKKSNNNNL